MALADTFPDDALPPLSDEWMTEIRHRSAERAAGAVTTIPCEVVMGEAIPDTLLTLTKRPGNFEPQHPRKKMKVRSRYFFIIAAFLSFVLSVSIWFLLKNESQAIFVGIWVPSILCLGRYFD
jgi:hypothetical protein